VDNPRLNLAGRNIDALNPTANLSVEAGQSHSLFIKALQVPAVDGAPAPILHHGFVVYQE